MGADAPRHVVAPSPHGVRAAAGAPVLGATTEGKFRRALNWYDVALMESAQGLARTVVRIPETTCTSPVSAIKLIRATSKRLSPRSAGCVHELSHSRG